VENEIFRQDWRSRKKSEILQYVAVKWASVFLLGILTATAALGINTAVENIAGLKFLWTVKFMQTER
jgi:chloride channel 7